MPSASQIAEAVVDFLEHRDPGPEYRAGPGEGRWHYDPINIVGNTSSGSQNWGPMLGGNALLHWHNKKNWKRVNEILDAWAEYAKLDLLTSEFATSNIYLFWILYWINIAYVVALMMGRPALAASLLLHLRSARVLMALSSGWRKNPSGFDGYPCCMTGARSWNTPVRYMVTTSSFGSGELSRGIGLFPSRGNDQLAKWSKRSNVAGSTAIDREVLAHIVHNRLTKERLALCLQWLREGPGFKANASIIRTSEMVAWCNETTINTGSTSYMMAKAWYSKDRPSYYDRHKWVKDKNSAWVTVDPPGRTKGAKCQGRITASGYEAQRMGPRKWKNGFVTMAESWFDELKGKEVPGWRKQLEFHGELKLHLRVGKHGIAVVYPDGDVVAPPPPPDDGTEEPPPPPGGPGWHTIKTAPAHLKFTNAAAEAAEGVLGSGGNHIQVSKVALEPAQAAQVLADLKRI